MKNYLLLSLIGFCLPVCAQTNLDGWRSAKWGMNVDAVVASFNGEVLKTPKEESWKDGVGLAELPKLEIQHQPFEAVFIFDKDKRTLKQIIVRPDKSVTPKDMLFEPLEQMLVEKYGKIDFSSDKTEPGQIMKTATKVRSWKRGHTRIELHYFAMSDGAGRGLETLQVIYEQIPDAGDNNL